MDSLHLASALKIRDAEALKFLTFDSHLQQIAQALMPDAFN